MHQILFFLQYLKPYLPLGVGLLLPCLVWIFYRPADKARRSAIRKTVIWLSGIVLWVLEPVFFYFWARNSGLDGSTLALRAAALCLIPALLVGWLFLRGGRDARRHLHLILISWCGVALAVAACRTAGEERYALLEGYFRTVGAAVHSHDDRLLPMQVVPEGKDAPLRVAYEDGGTEGLNDFFHAEKQVAQKRAAALQSLEDDVFHSQSKTKNGLTPDEYALQTGPSVFFDQVKLDQARVGIVHFRAYILGRQKIRENFYVEWLAAINSSRLNAETTRRILADFNQNVLRTKAIEKRVDDAQSGVLDTADVLLDMAQRGMGTNKPNGNGIMFAHDEDRLLYNQLYQRAEEYQRQQEDAEKDEAGQWAWFNGEFITRASSMTYPLGPYPPPVD